MKTTAFFLTTLLVSLNVFAALSSTVIEGVEVGQFERQLRQKMDVHQISIAEIKAEKLANKINKLFAAIDEKNGEIRQYKITMLVDESLFNKRQHIVKCKITDYVDKGILTVKECDSPTSSVTDMVFLRSELK